MVEPNSRYQLINFSSKFLRPDFELSPLEMEEASIVKYPELTPFIYQGWFDFVFDEKVTSKTYDILDPKPGTYEVFVWAVNPFTGFKSPPVTALYNYRTGPLTSTLLPPQNVRVVGTVGLVFNQPALSLTWDFNPAN